MRIQRAGLFERVSTEEQSKYGYSIQTQIDALNEYCKNNRIKIVDHYCDEGVSAGKPYGKRPEMKRLLDDVEAGKIDIILFTKLDRWFRNVKEYFKVQEILEHHRVEWKAIWEDYDTTTANGRMAITIFLAIAQNEREKTSERIKEVFENKRKRKESFFGQNSTPFGYMEIKDAEGITRLVKDPEVSDALEEFWNIAVKYNNINKAAKMINLEYGITRNRSKWYELARKEIYTGTYKGIEGYCPAYVSKEDWLRLRERGFIKKTQNDRVYLFAGLIKCPKCGKNLAGKYCKHNRANGVVKEYYSYKCNDCEIGLCEYKHTISQIKTEKWLIDHLEELIKDEIAKVEIERLKPRPKPNINVAALKEQLRKLEIVYMVGNKSDADYIREQNDIKKAIAKAESESPYDPHSRDIENLRELLETNIKGIYEHLDQEERRRFWRSLIKQIHVEGNEVVSVDFN